MPAALTGPDSLKFTSSAVEVQHLRAVGSIPGIRIVHVAARNGPGVGMLRTRFDGTAVSWRAPGSTQFGPDVPLAADGVYLVCDGSDAGKFIRVEAYVDFLVTTARSQPVILTDAFNNAVGYQDVAEAEASAGDVSVWSVLITNQSVSMVSRVRAWIDPAVADIELSSDAVSWYAPDSEGHADVVALADLAPAGTASLYLRRTVSAATPSDADVLNVIHLSFEGM